MTHIRQQVRDAVVTAVTGLATTGANVFKSRTLDVPQASLPALLVYTKDEFSELDTMDVAGGKLRRAHEVVIVALAQEAANVDAKLDAIAEEIEVAMFANRKLGGLARDSVLEETTQLLSGAGEQEQAGLRLVFTVDTGSARGVPGTVKL